MNSPRTVAFVYRSCTISALTTWSRVVARSIQARTIAINSVRLGFETMIYFTFEGLHMIRPGHLGQLRYFPTGVDPSEAEVGRYATLRNPGEHGISGQPAGQWVAGKRRPWRKAAIRGATSGAGCRRDD